MLSEDPTDFARLRRKDKRTGLLTIVVGFFACMGLSLWAMDVSTPKAAPPPAPPTKVGLIGFPSSLEPFSVNGLARKLSVRSTFRGFVAEGVSTAGTIDFTKPGRRLRYGFQSPQGLGPQPPRKGGTLPTRSYCGTQSVTVDEKGIYASKDNAKVKCPSKEPREIRLPKACSIQDLLSLAKKRRVPLEDNMRVEFYDSHRGPAYRLTSGGVVRLGLLTKDCKTVIVGRDQRGSVP